MTFQEMLNIERQLNEAWVAYQRALFRAEASKAIIDSTEKGWLFTVKNLREEYKERQYKP